MRTPERLSAPVNYKKSKTPGSSHPGLLTLIRVEGCLSISSHLPRPVREILIFKASSLPQVCGINRKELLLIRVD